MLGFILSHFREKLNSISNYQALSMLWKGRDFAAFSEHIQPIPAHCWQGARYKQSDSLHDPQHSGLLSRLQPCAGRFPSLADRMFRQILLALEWASLLDGMAAAK